MVSSNTTNIFYSKLEISKYEQVISTIGQSEHFQTFNVKVQFIQTIGAKIQRLVTLSIFCEWADTGGRIDQRVRRGKLLNCISLKIHIIQ